MNNWIDLSKIPVRDFGKKQIYDWKQSVGLFCDFKYNEIVGVLYIVDYNPKTNKLSISYNDEINQIGTDAFKAGKIMKLIGLRTNDFKVEIGTNFVDDNRNITVISRRYDKDKNGRLWKEYNYHCNICGWSDGWISEHHILHGIGCSCCRGLTVVRGINDVSTTHPEYLEYFVNIEDAYHVTYSSSKEVLLRCPRCGCKKYIRMDQFHKYGLGCDKCSDGISYPEKFMYSFLEQTKYEFVTQLGKKQLSWCDKYHYDFYIPFLNCIVETHGNQHYDGYEHYGFKSAEYEAENDKRKRELALNNNVEKYIELNCSKSNKEWMKNSIINSGLPSLLNIDIDNIDWDECQKYTTNSMLIASCNYKNNHPELSTTDIGKILNMPAQTIQKYLQRGSELGICIYDKNFERQYKTKDARLKYYSTKLNNQQP